jgi:regulator of cell morphogenesis and NO signaling
MNVDTTRTVKDIVTDFPSAARVFEEKRIDYCCGGQKTLQDACKEAQLPLDEVVQSIESAEAMAHTANPLADWKEASISQLIQHIVEKHHAYCRQEHEHLGTLLAKVVQVHGAHHPELARIQSLFNKMHAELAMHLVKEERTLFPMILEMENAAKAQKPLPRLPFGTIQNPVSMMILEHDETGTQLKEIHRLSQGYQAPEDACGSYRSLYEGLKLFEQDMHQHIYLENYVLFPRTVALEKQFDNLHPETA